MKKTCAAYLLVTCCAALVIPATALSQKKLTLEELYELPLEALLQIPVRSSTLTDKRLQSAPASVTVFSYNQIRNLGVEYLHELVNYVPGFQDFRQGESGDEYYHSARGHRSSTSSREVLILIDGVRFNREFDNAIAVPMLSLYNMEKIEFIRGPGSALYGANAFLGVIAITTRKEKNEAQIIVGENDHVHLQALGTTEFSGWKANVAVNAYTDDGQSFTLEDLTTMQLQKSNDPRSGEDILLDVHSDTTGFSLKHFTRESQDFYVIEELYNGYNQTDNQHTSADLNTKTTWSPSFQSQFSLQLIENSYKAHTFGASIGFFDVAQTERNINFKFSNDWTYAKAQSVQFGLEYRDSNIDATYLNTENFGTLLLYAENQTTNTGIYVQTQNHLASGTELVIGARYDHYDDIGSAFSPRLSVVQTLSSTQTVKLLYGEAFRAPTVNELLLENFTGGFTGNPDLNPETIRSWELIWTRQWNQQYLSVNAFYNTIDDLIVRTDTTAVSTFINQSSPESFHGFEVEYALQLLEHCMLSANYSNFMNLDDSDFRQADQLASLILNYNRNKWNLNLSAVYNSEREMLVGVNMISLDSYWLMNANWQYSFNPRFSMNVMARNLLDEDYDTPTQGAVHTVPIPNRGQELSLGLNLKF